jgi:arylsulfatase A-like enzyme
VDLTPTLLELMGQPIPDKLEGVSRVREMRDGGSLEDNPVFAEWNGNDNTELPADTSPELVRRVKNQPWRTIIHKGWKLNLSPADQCELYNLNRDPFEQVNLFDAPNEKGRVREMTARLKEWQKKTKDTTQLEL